MFLFVCLFYYSLNYYIRKERRKALIVLLRRNQKSVLGKINVNSEYIILSVGSQPLFYYKSL